MTKFRGLITDATPLLLYENCPEIISPIQALQAILRKGTLGNKYWIEQAQCRRQFLKKTFCDTSSTMKGTFRSSLASSSIEHSNQRSLHETQSRYSLTPISDDEMADYYSSYILGNGIISSERTPHAHAVSVPLSPVPQEHPLLGESHSRDSTPLFGNLASVASDSNIKVENMPSLNLSGSSENAAVGKDCVLDKLNLEEDDPWNSGYSSLTESDCGGAQDYTNVGRISSGAKDILQVSKLGLKPKPQSSCYLAPVLSRQYIMSGSKRGQVIPISSTM